MEELDAEVEREMAAERPSRDHLAALLDVEDAVKRRLSSSSGGSTPRG